MKSLFACVLLTLCFSCGFSERKAGVGNNMPVSEPDSKVYFPDSSMVLNSGLKIILKGDYKNFELGFDCKTGAGTIGAVYFHTMNGNTTTGYEVFINNNIEPKEWRKTGGLTTVRSFGKRTCGNDVWFPIRISVAGKQVKTFSNNIPVVDYTEPEQPYRETEYLYRVLSEGCFVFECKSGEPLQIRNIKVKRLPDDIITGTYAVNEQVDDIIKLHQHHFPVIDYHIHTKGGLTAEKAGRIARKYGITYAVAPNCGLDFPIKDDVQLLGWLEANRREPFLLPMQAEGREWTRMFSPEAISRFDYVFTDALTWSDHKGRRLRLWIPEDTYIDDEQVFMDELTEVTCRIIETEPIQVLANPTFLPDVLARDYDRLWTEKRMLRIINAAVKHRVALELNNLNKIPSSGFVKLAKQRGVKFTFGTNNAGSEQIEKMEYVIRECGLTASDMYIPVSKNF